MTRLAAMNAEQRKELNRDKRRAKTVDCEAEMHEYEIKRVLEAWRRDTEAGKACAATHAAWQKAVWACNATIAERATELLANAIRTATANAAARAKLEVCERTGKTELVTSPAGPAWERPPRPETRESIEAIRAEVEESTRKASEAMEAVCTLESRQETARAELARLKSAEPSLVPSADDGTAEYAAYANAIAKRETLATQLKELRSAIVAKRTRFRVSNTAAAAGDAKRSKVVEEEEEEDEDEEE